jgi:hypothetical protein
MASYISSNENRFYTALEQTYGEAGAITAACRIPAVKLSVQRQQETPERKDKTGSRSYAGTPPGGRKRTSFELRTYLTGWDKSKETPGYGPLFQAAMGAPALTFAGATASSCSGTGRLSLAGAHGLSVGQGVGFGGEIRFVTGIIDPSTVQLNAPFTTPPGTNAPLYATVTYLPATGLPSATIYDYWSPATSVQRLLCGAAVDQMEIVVNGDYHEVRFRGMASDVIDSASFTASAAALDSFPPEPAMDTFDYSVVPGNLGQAWVGAPATQFFTLTSASVVLRNNIETRSREFGSNVPRAIAPGQRSVTATFDLYAMDDAVTASLYQAARQGSPISVMFQLGETEGQIMGVYLQSVVPEVPEFDDGESRLQWHFRPSRAQGTVDDEIAVAFA